MRLVTYLPLTAAAPQSPFGGTGFPGLHIGALGSGEIIDCQKAFEALGITPLPRDVLDIIERDSVFRQPLETVLKAFAAAKLTASCIKPESQVRILSPLPRPLSVRDGYAFRQHVEAARRNRGLTMIPEFDLFPIIYYSNALAVTGPGDVPVQKLAQEKLDFELEVAMVVGKSGRNIPADKADEHIFGYMIMNDWSARALQMEEMKLNLGPAKGKDFATSFGPYLVTRDELLPSAIPSSHGERHFLEMKCWVNGKLLSQGNTKDIHWTFAQILERTSYGTTVFPGEVIGSGTVGTGCLLELNGSKITDNLWLKPGDKVEMEVEKLGRLTNQIVDCSEKYIEKYTEKHQA